jgi:hypothetical protein
MYPGRRSEIKRSSNEQWSYLDASATLTCVAPSLGLPPPGEAAGKLQLKREEVGGVAKASPWMSRGLDCLEAGGVLESDFPDSGRWCTGVVPGVSARVCSTDLPELASQSVC